MFKLDLLVRKHRYLFIPFYHNMLIISKIIFNDTMFLIDSINWPRFTFINI